MTSTRLAVGQRLNDWTEIPPQAGILNPGWKLEWTRYSQWITTDFLAWQAELVNQYKRPDQFVTHTSDEHAMAALPLMSMAQDPHTSSRQLES